MDFENSLLQAMDMISSKRIAEAGFDKTVQATIIECVDESIGKYKVRYQDGFWYAFSNNIDTKYIKGTSVYILIPNGNMNNEKTILGSTEKLGINYTYIEDEQDRYLPIGANVIGDTERHALCSYETETLVLYDENGQNNIIAVDDESLIQYVKTADHFILSMFVQTSLPVEQRFNGNYGLKVYAQFRDNSTQLPVTRTYIFDTSLMTGNPYLYVSEMEQKAYFSIDAENFQKIKRIEAFVADFPKQESNHDADIFLSGISLCAAEFLPEEQRNGVALNLITRRGLIFTNSDSSDSERTIEGQVRLKNKTVPSTSQDLSFYWFRQNNRITADNLYYTRYGGQGWQCLNQYVTVQASSNNSSTPAVVQFVKGSYVYTVKKSDVTSKYTKYKCVVVYGENIISKQFTVVNLQHQYDIEIESDRGTTFVNDSGVPTLTCIVKDSNGNIIDNPTNSFDFIWTVVNNNGVFELLQESDGSEPEGAQRVQGNKIYNVQINQIVHYSIFKCSVYSKNSTTQIGSASITLTNELNVELNYILMINNGSQVFNYNEYGVSPTNLSFENPYVIPELGFTLYDKKGQEIPQSYIRNEDVTWTVPIKNTLIQLNESYNQDSTVSQDGNYRIITGVKTLVYGIADRYAIDQTDNTIQLKINYQGSAILAQTNFTFTKQGDIGTNGTEYQIRIVPNLPDGQVYSEYPTIYCLDNSTWHTNWHHKTGSGNNYSTSNGYWFKVQLWHNGERIFDGITNGNSTTNKPVAVEWSILKNRYTASTFDISCLSVNQNNNGYFSFIYNNTINSVMWVANQQKPANIIQAKITFDGLEYYATMPIIVVKSSNAIYNAILKKNTGFRYAIYKNDGTEPSYDDHAPFEIIVTNNNNEISQNCTYTWLYVNSYKNRSGTVYYNDPVYLEEAYRSQDSNLTVNQQIVYPADGYDGRTVNNAIIVTIKSGSTTILQMHIPIHLFFNRYENAALNGWNGNSIEINENGGLILAPQIGAGRKNQNNTFTGLVMGRVVGQTDLDEEVGLFGYNQGARSIFLDAETGKAVFGQTGKGQIILDPSENEAIITSGNYNTSRGTGMQINLTAPSITYGSGNFIVDSTGKLTANGADITGTINAQHGTIGSGNKINIGEWTKKSGTTIVDSDSAIWYGKNNGFEDTSYGFYLGSKGVSIGSGFFTDSLGRINASDMTINNGSIEIKDTNNQTIFSANSSGVDIVNGSISISQVNGTTIKRIFDVDSSGLYLEGEVNATSGYIGGWQINNGVMTNGGITLGNDGTGQTGGLISALSGLFSISNSGGITALSGKIGPWFIEQDAISKTLDGTAAGDWNTTNHIYFGNSGLSFGQNLLISPQGHISIKKGQIALGYDTTNTRWNFFATDDGSVTARNLAIRGGSIQITGLAQDYQYIYLQSGNVDTQGWQQYCSMTPRHFQIADHMRQVTGRAQNHTLYNNEMSYNGFNTEQIHRTFIDGSKTSESGYYGRYKNNEIVLTRLINMGEDPVTVFAANPAYYDGQRLISARFYVDLPTTLDDVFYFNQGTDNFYFKDATTSNYVSLTSLLNNAGGSSGGDVTQAGNNVYNGNNDFTNSPQVILPNSTGHGTYIGNTSTSLASYVRALIKSTDQRNISVCICNTINNIDSTNLQLDTTNTSVTFYIRSGMCYINVYFYFSKIDTAVGGTCNIEINNYNSSGNYYYSNFPNLYIDNNSTPILTKYTGSLGSTVSSSTNSCSGAMWITNNSNDHPVISFRIPKFQGASSVVFTGTLCFPIK